MVDISSSLDLLIVIFAGLASILGIIVLEAFFRNKLKDLFDDNNYFIFFFLVAGYFLYALGEVAFYQTWNVLKDDAVVGISDIYWTAGSILILVSFIALSIMLCRQYGTGKTVAAMASIGVILVAVILFVIFNITLQDQGSSPFAYFYPIASALIIAFSLSVIFFYSQLGDFKVPLVLFFSASCAIFVGDLLFTHALAQEIYQVGFAGILGDLFYFLGYVLSAAAFVVLRLRMKELANN